MNRPRSYTIAAVLMFLYSLIGAIFELPNLARGSVEAVDGPPFFMTVISFVLAVLGFVAAYGVWRMQKWSVVLAIMLAALGILTSLPAIIFAPLLSLRLFAGLGVVWGAAIIVLLLRPGLRSTTA